MKLPTPSQARSSKSMSRFVSVIKSVRETISSRKRTARSQFRKERPSRCQRQLAHHIRASQRSSSRENALLLGQDETTTLRATTIPGGTECARFLSASARAIKVYCDFQFGSIEVRRPRGIRLCARKTVRWRPRLLCQSEGNSRSEHW